MADNNETEVEETQSNILSAELSKEMRTSFLELKIGLKGSPTRVQKSFVPERCSEGVLDNGKAW